MCNHIGQTKYQLLNIILNLKIQHLFHKTVFIIFILFTSNSSLAEATNMENNSLGSSLEFIDKINGIWEGVGSQNGNITWSIRLEINDGTYMIEYPSLSCGGTWSLISNTDFSATFIETISFGSNCIDQGTIELFVQDDNMLKMIYYMPDGDVVAYGDFICNNCQLTNLDGFVDVLDNVWQGNGIQNNNPSWSIILLIDGNNYLIEYPSLGCGGTWVLLSITQYMARFFEDITFGSSCVDEGNVEVYIKDINELRYIYYLPNGDIFAYGELFRQDEIFSNGFE